MKQALLSVLVLVGGLGITPAAWATFPGRNGELAVTTTDGLGTQLVQPSTGHATPLCSTADFATPFCHETSMPSWSPDGRLLAFSTSDIL
jgi:hypothetical protein